MRLQNKNLSQFLKVTDHTKASLNKKISQEISPVTQLCTLTNNGSNPGFQKIENGKFMEKNQCW
jgi:hypothetical protein